MTCGRQCASVAARYRWLCRALARHSIGACLGVARAALREADHAAHGNAKSRARDRDLVQFPSAAVVREHRGRVCPSLHRGGSLRPLVVESFRFVTATGTMAQDSIAARRGETSVRLLVIEDDEVFGTAVNRHLSSNGHVVDWLRIGGEVAIALNRHAYDGVLLDLGLPDGPADAALRLIKAHRSALPVLVMTARGAIHDRVQLLDLGADDYMVKPLDLDELSARLRALIRRKPAPPEADVELGHGALRLTPARRAVTWHGEPVQLTNKEYLLLEYLVRRKHHVLTRSQLEATLFADGDEIGSNALEVYVHFLRRKFGHSLIETVRGVGYQLGDLNRAGC